MNTLPHARHLPLLSRTIGLLFIAVLVSSIAVAYSAHGSRQLLNTLFVEIKQRERLQAEWGRLVLEHSTWTAHNRIEKLAVEQLGMHVPEPGSVIVVSP